nr:DNA mismatch repair protein MutS [Cytophagales bacterium]
MNIGDRVRLLHGKEEGVITKISGGGQVEIEIEDGFRIPALKSEVVIISNAEKEFFGTPEEKIAAISPPGTKKPGTDHAEGIYLAYVPYNDQNHGIFLINNTKREMLYAVSEIFGENSKTMGAGVASSNAYYKLDEKSVQHFENWPPLFIQIIPLNARAEKTQAPFERKVSFKASSFFRSKRQAPVMYKDAYLFQLDTQIKDLDITQLNKDLNPERADAKPITQQFTRPPKEVDLHIEKLSNSHESLSNGEKIKLQLEMFEKNLNYAIASGMDEITFIHGIGNGVLRKEIHRYLSQLNHISYFKDTHKSNFGYGATLVKING